MLLALILVIAQAPQVNSDPISGGAGWVGAGLLGAVLAWLMFVHIPAGAKQMRELIASQQEERAVIAAAQVQERERERESRHKIANIFQAGIAEIVNEHHGELMKLQEGHLRDAERDRQAFLERSQFTKLAIEQQTAQLIAAMQTSCRYHPLNQVQERK